MASKLEKLFHLVFKGIDPPFSPTAPAFIELQLFTGDTYNDKRQSYKLISVPPNRLAEFHDSLAKLGRGQFQAKQMVYLSDQLVIA